MKKYIILGLQWLLVLFFIIPGIMKVTGEASIREVFSGFGYSLGFMYFIGVCEILGALGIAFGRHIHSMIPKLAVIGLIIIMVGALYNHVNSGEAFSVAMPALINLVLLGVYFKILLKDSVRGRIEV